MNIVFIDIDGVLNIDKTCAVYDNECFFKTIYKNVKYSPLWAVFRQKEPFCMNNPWADLNQKPATEGCVLAEGKKTVRWTVLR